MSNYNYNTLCHHGIKGQKWGIRRFQNNDGTLTAEGRKRYGVDSNGQMSKEGKKLYRKELNETEWAEARKHDPTSSMVSDMVRGFGIGATIGVGSSLMKGDFDGMPVRAALYGVLTMPLMGSLGIAAENIRNKRIDKGKQYIKENMNVPVKKQKNIK